jgi:hypothetical protein
MQPGEAAAALPPPASLWPRVRGRAFINPFFDYLIIGGGLSLMVTALLWTRARGDLIVAPGTMAYLLLLATSAHFAASTVRLYSKPGAAKSLPVLSRWLPWGALAVLTLFVFMGGKAGKLLETVYLTWSPYHYSAQAYGLSVVYAYRSGCRLEAQDKRWLWWVAMLPFFVMAVHMVETRLPELLSLAPDTFVAFTSPVQSVIRAFGWVAPAVLYVHVWRSKSGPLPFIALLTLVSNAVWFFVLDPMDAFLWATIFHGLQYMAIVMIFDVREQVARPGNSRGAFFHAAWFYGASLVLGYVLFVVLPNVYRLAGFDYYDARLVSVAVINIHHFIVDAYIWRLSGKVSNREIVGGVA